MAGVFAARGNQGLVVHGGDGLDELTTTTSSTVWVYADGEVERTEFDPAELGVPRARIADLVGGDAAVNAQVVWDLVAGKPGPVRDIVTLNAAAALVAYAKPVAGRLVEDLADQLRRANEAIDSGAAQRQAHGVDRSVPGRRCADHALANRHAVQRRRGLPGQRRIGVVRHQGGRDHDRTVIHAHQQHRQRVVAARQPFDRVPHPAGDQEARLAFDRVVGRRHVDEPGRMPVEDRLAQLLQP